MIFRATNSSSFLFNPIYPVFLTRKYLGTPLSLNRRNLIFRVKIVESASLNLTLNSALNKLDSESSTNNITLRSANVIPLYNPATLYNSLNGVSTPSLIGDKIDYAQSLNSVTYTDATVESGTILPSLNNLSLKLEADRAVNSINISNVKLIDVKINVGNQNIALNGTIYDTPLLSAGSIYNTLNNVNHYQNLTDQIISNITLNGSSYYTVSSDAGNTNISLNSITNYQSEIDKAINSANLYSTTHLSSQVDIGSNNSQLLGSSYYTNVYDASQTAVSTVGSSYYVNYSDASQTAVTVLGSQYYVNLYDASQIALTVLGSQYYVDFYNASQTALTVLGSQYYVDFYDASQTAETVLGSQYYVDFYDASQTAETVLGSQYYVNFYDASQNAVATVGWQYYVNFYDASQNAVSTVGSQYYVNYSDVSQTAVSILGSQYYVDYSDVSQTAVSILGSQYYVDYSDTSIITSNISGLSNYVDFSDISSHSVSFNRLSTYVNFGDSSISNNGLSSLNHNLIQPDIINEDIKFGTLNYTLFQNDVIAQTNGLNSLLLKTADYGANVSFATSLNSITSIPNEYIKSVTQNSSVLTNLSMLQGPYANSMTYNMALNNLKYSLGEYGILVNNSDSLRKLVYEDESNSKLVNQTSNLKSLKYDDTTFEINVSENNRLSSLRSELDANNKLKISGSFKQISYAFNFIDTVLGSNITFRPYSTASAVTFNSDSPTNYVNQVNIIYYMYGGNLTQSIINYGSDLEFKVIGNSNPGLYISNYDYNTPYRSSFVTKNWPIYQYDTSSNWKLPVILNCSNNERKISSTSSDWVEVALEVGGTLVDEYGFSIDI